MKKSEPSNTIGGNVTYCSHYGKLEKEKATQSCILAWKIPWTEEPGRLQFMGAQRVRYDLLTKQQLWKIGQRFLKKTKTRPTI